MNDQFANLQDLLYRALSDTKINYYAYALSRSRTQFNPTQRSFELVIQLIHLQGSKWIEVLQRLGIHNYQLAFSICKDEELVFPTLVHIANPITDQQILLYLQNRIFQLLTVSTADHKVMWCALVQLMNRSCQSPLKENRLFLLNNINSALQARPYFFDSINNLDDNSMQKEMFQSIYLITKYKFIYTLARLYKNCSSILRSSLCYLQHRFSLINIVNWLRKQYQQIFSNTIVGDYKVSRQEDLLKCLYQLVDLVDLDSTILQYRQNIIKILLNINLLPYWQGSSQQQFNYEYGLIYQEHGQDLPSYLTKSTTALVSLPGFLRKYFMLVMQLGNIQDILMRLAIIHKQLLNRSDIMDELVLPFLEQIIMNLQQYVVNMSNQADFCRKVRLMMLFSDTLKQKYIKKLLSCALDMIRYEPYTSFCSVEGFNIIKEIHQKTIKDQQKALSRTAIILNQQSSNIVIQIILIIVQTYQQYPIDIYSAQRQGKLCNLYMLLEDIISRHQKDLQSKIPQILMKCCDWATIEAQSSWRRGIRSTEVLNLLIRINKMCVMIIKQDYYIDLASSIYNLLNLLKNHNIRDYQEDLIQILAFVINFQSAVSSQIFTIIIELPRIIQSNKSLSCVLPIIKAICSQKVASNMLFSWPDLCKFFLNIFINYINHINQNYIENYPREWQQILVIFGTFLQIYDQFLQDDKQSRANVLYCINSIKQEQLRLQLFLIMDYSQIIQHYKFYDISCINRITKRTSFRLLFLYYCNQLRICYSENTMLQFIQIYKIYKQKVKLRNFINEINVDWPYLVTSTHTYISELLKQLKKQGHIDIMQFSMYRRQFQLSY